MPLNVNDQNEDEAVRPDKPKAQPIGRAPVQTSVTAKNIVIAIFILVVLASIAFLVYLFTSVNLRDRTSQQTSRAPSSQPPVSIVQPGSPSVAEKPPPSTEQPSPSSPVQKGRYTIYIASYLDREPAAEEVGRWNEAGYRSFVVQAVGHFRVALGLYEHVSKARQDAEDLSEAFENGYWIGYPQ